LERLPTCAFIRKNKGFAIVATIADKTNATGNGMIIDRNISDTTVVTMTMAGEPPHVGDEERFCGHGASNDIWRDCAGAMDPAQVTCPPLPLSSPSLARAREPG